MSTAENVVQYSIHCEPVRFFAPPVLLLTILVAEDDPDGSVLPQLPKKRLVRLPCLETLGKTRYRPLHAKFIVGAAHDVVYDLKAEHDMHLCV